MKTFLPHPYPYKVVDSITTASGPANIEGISDGWTYDSGNIHIVPAPHTTLPSPESVTIYSPIHTNNESEDEMRGLFLAWVVDSDEDVVIYQTDPFVAKDEDAAERKLIQRAASDLTKDVDDYDFCLLRLGDVRQKKQVQKVEVVKE